MPETINPTTSEQCYAKAMTNNEEIFVLRAQDVTADIVVEAWADIQRLLGQFLRRGYTLTQALHQIKAHLLPIKQALEPQPTTKKIDEAYAIAKRMAAHVPRKVAD